jgi:hypothetical protein
MIKVHRLIAAYNQWRRTLMLFSALIMQSGFQNASYIELDLSKALFKNELHFHFQPQVNEHSKTLGGIISAMAPFQFGQYCTGCGIPGWLKSDLICI